MQWKCLLHYTEQIDMLGEQNRWRVLGNWMPRALDLPMSDADLVEVANPGQRHLSCSWRPHGRVADVAGTGDGETLGEAVSEGRMARVWIPPLLRDLTGGRETVPVPGANVGQLIEALEQRFPGVRSRLCPDGVLRPGLAVIVDGQVGR